MTSKVCFKCNEEKGLSEFYKHNRMKDGHLNKCKTCTKSDVRLDRQTSENARERDRLRYHNDPKRKQHCYDNAKQWRINNPERAKAIEAANNALRSKRIERKTKCEKCGAAEPLHKHHEDYSKPLDVMWLCPKCHHRHHAEERHKADAAKIS